MINKRGCVCPGRPLPQRPPEAESSCRALREEETRSERQNHLLWTQPDSNLRL